MNNYTLNTGKKYIKDIFSSDSFYNIPDYQRPYVWESSQVNDLLNDLNNAMDKDRREYFLGCMIWDTKKIKDNGVEYSCQDILDGQQRFITVYILQAIIRDISNKEDLKETVKESMRQKGKPLHGIPERNRIEFSIRDDRVFIEDFLIKDNGTLKKYELDLVIKNSDSNISIRNMANSIIIIKKWFEDKKSKFTSEKEFQDYLYEFYAYISTKVLILYLAVPDNLDDAHNLFTVLNSRGVQLQFSDILKAQNLRLLNDENRSKNSAKKWEDYENVVNESPFNSFDEFLWSLIFIKMKYRSDDNQSLKKAFEHMDEKGIVKKGKDTFALIDKYITHLKIISEENIQTQDSGCLFSNLNNLLTLIYGNTYLSCLMHYRECFGEIGIVDFIIKIDNLFSVFWLLNNRNLQTRVFMILRKMDEIVKTSKDMETLSEVFLNDPILSYNFKDEKASSVEVNIKDLFELFDSEKWGSFGGSRINKTRYILLKLDLIMSNLNNRLYFNNSMISVEHLMPQKMASNEWSISEEEHEKWLHRLGNIVLVDKKKNSSLSNSSYSKKKNKYQGSIENRSNTNYIFMKYSDWDVSTIKENHKRVLELLKSYYQANNLKAIKELKKNNTLTLKK